MSLYKRGESLPLAPKGLACQVCARPFSATPSADSSLRNASLFVFCFFCLIFSSCHKSNTKIQEQEQSYPQHIISLSPSSTEILFAVGAGSQIAAVSDFSDYPPQALELPKVGGFDGKSLSLESIISYKPDFVYLTQGMHDFLISSLEEYGIKYFVSCSNNISDIFAEILEISKITGHQEQGQEVVNSMKNQLVQVKSHAEVSQETVKVYWEVWNPPFISAGRSSFVNDVILGAGGENLFYDVEEAYPVVSEESIILRQPEVILVARSSGLTAQDVSLRNGWSEIPAVKNQRIYIVDDDLCTRPGPRIIQAMQILNNYFYQ